jgi:hypothetical protein
MKQHTAVSFLNWTLSGDCDWTATDENQWTKHGEGEYITTSELFKIYTASHPESPQPDKDAEIKEALRVGVNIGMQNVEKPRFEGDYNFNQAKALKECDEYLKSLPDLRSHPTDREVWVEVEGLPITKAPENIGECFQLDFGGVLLEISKVNGKWMVTNGVDGWGNNVRDVYRDAEVKLSTLLQDREQAEPVRELEIEGGIDIPDDKHEEIMCEVRVLCEQWINQNSFNRFSIKTYLYHMGRFGWELRKYATKDREQPAPDREKGNDEASGSALI